MKPTKEMIEAFILTSSTAAGGTEDCVSAGLTAALAAMPGPAEIVPQHCSGYSFVFEPGVLHVRKNGSGYIVVNEDDFILEDDRYEGEHGPEGSVHWIAKLDASEIVALRDFLNGVPTTPAPDLAAENERLRGLLRNAPDVRHFQILAEAMAEVKATNDGQSDQTITEIVDGCLAEISALEDRT